jgi:hypothetical protein
LLSSALRFRGSLIVARTVAGSRLIVIAHAGLLLTLLIALALLIALGLLPLWDIPTAWLSAITA